MTTIVVETTDTFEQWRVKTNLIAAGNIPNLIAPVSINVNSTVSALRITQTGAGNVIVVEDSEHPDLSPFIVTGSGNVGIGTSAPQAKLDVYTGDTQFYGAHPSYGGYGYGGAHGLLGQALSANTGVRGYNSTTNSNGYLGHPFYGVHGVGPVNVGEGQSIGVFGLVAGSANIALGAQNQSTGSYGYIGLSGFGVQGYGGTSNVNQGSSVGVYGQSAGAGNIGVYGRVEQSFGYLGFANTFGVYGEASNIGAYFVGKGASARGIEVRSNNYSSFHLDTPTPDRVVTHVAYTTGGNYYGLHTTSNVYAGNVGVGISPPSVRLDVLGRMRVGSDTTGADSGTGSVFWNTAGGDGGYAAYQQIFYTGENNARVERMRILNTGNVNFSGNVGIGTNPTRSKLHVTGAGAPFYGVNETTQANALLGAAGFGVQGYGGVINVGNGGSVGVYGQATGLGNIGVYGLNVTSSKYGFLGYSVYGVYSSGNIYTTESVIEASDARLKEDVITISNALDTISNLRGVWYTLKENKARKMGMIAQEVQQVVPEVVDNSSEYLGLQYTNLVGLLVEAIKELKQEVDELKNK
jgi:hypothetical protein